MIDFKAIANDDPGGSVDSAYASLSVMKIDTTPELRLDYKAIGAKTSHQTSLLLQKAIQAAIAANQLAAYIDEDLNDEGLDVNNPQTQALLDLLVGGAFTQEMADSIKAAGVVQVLKFPGLEPSHIVRARQKRLSGEV